MDGHAQSPDYLEKRQLRTGTAGWLLLAGLGVSYVVSGDYSGWNFGLARGGFGGRVSVRSSGGWGGGRSFGG